MNAAPTDQPVPPVEPALEDCCTSGCVYCVFDVYAEALERYQIALAAWESAQAAPAATQQ